MELAYEVEALAIGWRLGLHTSDWRNLIVLAHRYGWKPTAGLDRYLHKRRRQIVPAHEARAHGIVVATLRLPLFADVRSETSTVTVK
jgi:hypothetical protein